jgi:N-acetylmuramoyl-L-alanine amidase
MASVAASPIATGDQLFDLAALHIGDKYILGTLVPKNNPNWTGPWDCAEFASWLHFQIGSVLYGCDRDVGDPSTADAFTGYWKRDAMLLGNIVSIEVAAKTKGAAVLRFPAPGSAGHIVISDGLGGTVEAHSHNDGVIQSTLAQRRWDLGILVPFLQYSSGPSVAVAKPQTAIFRLTTPPMRSKVILAIQARLKTLGFDPGTADGEFGPHTLSAVVAFQLSQGLTGDGEVGPQTAKALGITLTK